MEGHIVAGGTHLRVRESSTRLLERLLHHVVHQDVPRHWPSPKMALMRHHATLSELIASHVLRCCLRRVWHAVWNGREGHLTRVLLL